MFEQEGWHYELDDANSEGEATPERLRYNGVVFNEMKGALSDPEQRAVSTSMNAALFPGTCYAFESGGHPRAIPQLTYEQLSRIRTRATIAWTTPISCCTATSTLDRMLAISGRPPLPFGRRSRRRARPLSPTAHVASASRTPPVRWCVATMATAPENACVGLGYVIGDARDFARAC